MARYGSDEVAFLLVDGFSILGVQTTFRDEKEALTEETTALGGSWTEHEAVGVKRATFEQAGFYDDAANGANEALNEQQGASRVLCYGVAGNVPGRKMTGFQGATQVSYQRLATRGALHRANARYLGSGQVDEGVIVHAHQAEASASGDEASVDSGEPSAGGAVGYLQVSALALGGHDDLTVRIQHSGDNITFADLIVFTAVSSAPTAERKTAIGTIQRYVRATWTFNGTGSGQSVTFLVGLARG